MLMVCFLVDKFIFLILNFRVHASVEYQQWGRLDCFGGWTFNVLLCIMSLSYLQLVVFGGFFIFKIFVKNSHRRAYESLQGQMCAWDRRLYINRCVKEIAAFYLFPFTACVFSFPDCLNMPLFILLCCGQNQFPLSFYFYSYHCIYKHACPFVSGWECWEVKVF